jgi:hypothetical protein
MLASLYVKSWSVLGTANMAFTPVSPLRSRIADKRQYGTGYGFFLNCSQVIPAGLRCASVQTQSNRPFRDTEHASEY